VALKTIRDFEPGRREPLQIVRSPIKQALEQALEQAGIEFLRGRRYIPGRCIYSFQVLS
jgi:hypothetical protein